VAVHPSRLGATRRAPQDDGLQRVIAKDRWYETFRPTSPRARSREHQTVLLTPQKNGSGPLTTPDTFLRHAERIGPVASMPTLTPISMGKLRFNLLLIV
jgi:hypothetical protein